MGKAGQIGGKQILRFLNRARCQCGFRHGSGRLGLIGEVIDGVFRTIVPFFQSLGYRSGHNSPLNKHVRYDFVSLPESRTRQDGNDSRGEDR
jgi:hypothetical protein